MSRIDKVNQELRHNISLIIQQKLNDPSIGFITVTSVSTTVDLSDAKVYFTCMGDNAQRERALIALNKASGYIKKLLARRVYIKFMPKIKFIYDDTIQQKEKIDKIFDDIRKEEGAIE